MLYSVKMRSSLGGTHGKGGRHISGAERIVSEELVDETVISMMRRAREHERGCADFIQVKVEEVPDAAVSYCLMLPLYQMTRARSPRDTGQRRLSSSARVFLLWRPGGASLLWKHWKTA